MTTPGPPDAQDTPGTPGTQDAGRDLLPVATGRDAARVAWRLLRRRPLALAGAVVAFALSGLAGLAGPWVLGRIVDVVAGGAGGAGSGGDGRDVVLGGAALVAAAAVVGAVASALAVWLLARAGQPALAALREDVVDRALHLDHARVEEAGAGDLLSRVGDDVRQLAVGLTEVAPLVVGSLVAIAFTTGGLFALDWRLGLAGLVTVPSYAGALVWYLPRSGPFYRRERIAQGERAEALVAGIHAARTIRAHGLSAAQQARVEDRSWRAARLELDVFALLLRFGARMNRSELVGLLLVLGTGFVLVRADAVTVGEVTTAALFFHRLFNPVQAVLGLFDRVQSAGASLTRLVGVASLPEPVPGTAPPRDATLVLRGLGHAYAGGRPVLAGVDLEVRPGERLAVVGATGAGKTTLGALAAGTLEPTEGRAELGGLPVRTVRDHVAVVTQEVHVFAGTVADDLRLARPGATDVELADALRATGALDWVTTLPEGLGTVVGDGGHALTPAQAQHLALTRVLLADPALLVLDEATAEAGSAGARDLERAALAVAAGRTTLAIAHRLTQAATADRVLVLHEGRVAELGTHDELVAAGGRYAELWAAWRRA